MKVEIWFDIVCPFCYIGKRRFEAALKQFDHSDEVTIEWKSFQLNPDLKSKSDISINEYLAKVKGWTPEQVKKMNQRITEMAETVGLEYNLANTGVANSFTAHRLIQYSKTQDKSDEAVEALFRAYFIDGKNLEDQETLLTIASDINLDIAEAKEMLQVDNFTGAVKKNVQEARRMNIGGIPFFLFNRQFGVSGAQKTERFISALEKSWKEEQPPVELSTLDDSDDKFEKDGNVF